MPPRKGAGSAGNASGRPQRREGPAAARRGLRLHTACLLSAAGLKGPSAAAGRQSWKKRDRTKTHRAVHAAGRAGQSIRALRLRRHGHVVRRRKEGAGNASPQGIQLARRQASRRMESRPVPPAGKGRIGKALPFGVIRDLSGRAAFGPGRMEGAAPLTGAERRTAPGRDRGRLSGRIIAKRRCRSLFIPFARDFPRISRRHLTARAGDATGCPIHSLTTQKWSGPVLPVPRPRVGRCIAGLSARITRWALRGKP